MFLHKMERLAMRLSNDSMLTIKQAVTLIFGKDAKVYLFGSRTDDAKKGGDIDLYIETDCLEARSTARLCYRNATLRYEQGGADHDWCQFHYSTGELYRRQRSDIYRCLSELKQMVLG